MANQHFFKPLLPGFHSHLTIPKAFFLKNIEGINEKNKTVKLRSDASKISWEVKIDDQRLTFGWEEFALAHDLRIGDILVFRQEHNMTFHVTILGPSCCEIQYKSCLDDKRNLEKIQRNYKKVKENLKRESDSCFVANLAPSTLRYDTMYLPRRFARANDLDTRSGKIVLMNEKGNRSWTLALKQKKSCGTVFMNRGWRSFCNENGLKAGDILTFKLIQRGRTMVLSLTSKESKEECLEANEVESLSTESESDEDKKISQECSRRKVKKRTRSMWKASSLPSQNQLVTLTFKPYKLNLPLPFTRMNKINEETQMNLLDKHGVKWSTKLRSEKKSKRIRLLGGWKDFFEANCVKIGESVLLKLIWEEDTSCVLKFCSNVKPETI